MNLVKTAAIVFVLAIGAALVVLSASAQQPTPLPHVHIAVPVTPPPGWVPKTVGGSSSALSGDRR